MMDSLVQQGLELMGVGMGIVFVFLTCLVFATASMSRLVQYFHPEVVPGPDTVTEEEVAAISAAIFRYRQDRLKS